MLDIHYWPTPNGKKLTILMEELGVEYNLVICSIGTGEQFSEAFLTISPNNRMPAIVDQDPGDGAEPLSVFESGACMMYIAEKYARFNGEGLHQRWEVNQWVMWQMANQGPKTGERGHFARLKDSQGDQSYALTRFADELHRLYGVMNNRLYDRRYLAGDFYSIADMASYPWTAGWEKQGIDIDEFKYFKRWFEELSERPAVQRGMEAGSEMSQDYASLSEEDIARVRALLYNQRARPAPETGGIE
jgi:GST-like protein